MKLILDNEKYDLVYLDTFTKKLFSLAFKGTSNKIYYISDENKLHTILFKEKVDIVAINKKNVCIFKYQNVSPNKFIEISNDKYDTDILIMPLNLSKNIRINEVLCFINEYII